MKRSLTEVFLMLTYATSIFLVGFTAKATAGCNPSYEVCDFPSRTEIAKRSVLVPFITKTRRELRTQWAKSHERVLERGSWIDYSCVEGVTITHEGNFNVALCMPDWMRRVPPSASLTFRRIGSKGQRVMYLVVSEDIKQYYRYRYR